MPRSSIAKTALSRVLFVEGDDPESNRMVTNGIAVGRFEPVVCTPETARSHLHSADLILLDVTASELPLTLLSHLWCERPELPAVIISDGDIELGQRAHRAGVNSVLTFPFTETELRFALLSAQQLAESGVPNFTRQLARIMSIIGATMDGSSESMQKVLREVASLFHVERASILLIDPKKPNEMRFGASLGIPQEVVDQVVVAVGEGISGRVAASGIPELVLRPVERFVAWDRPIHASVSVPVRDGNAVSTGNIIGVMNLARTVEGEVFTPRDLEVCEFLAAHIGEVLGRVALDEKQGVLQQQMAAVEKLSYAGELAAGIAHEVASPIGYVGSNLRTLAEYLEDLGPALEALRKAAEGDGAVQLSPDADRDLIIDALEDLPDLIAECNTGIARASTIVDDMKAMVRMGGQDSEKAPVELEPLVKNTLHLLRPRLADRCKVTTEFATGATVWGREVELSQVLVNTVVNACDACVERVKTQGGDPAQITVRTEVLGDTIALSVIDNGVGIPKDKIEQIFAPLFTTKANGGGGTGLGLGIVQRIVTSHEGRIEVTSEVGVGTTFRFILPSHLPDGAGPARPGVANASASPAAAQFG